jgi:5-dehydro-2-deoxygluconokinase
MMAETAQPDGNQEFYLVHKIAMDISFRVECGIFIPHTRFIASQTPTDPEAERTWCRFFARQLC